MPHYIEATSRFVLCILIIGLRHCAELNYGDNATSAASYIIVSEFDYCHNYTLS